jgi:hypothetical protein
VLLGHLLPAAAPWSPGAALGMALWLAGWLANLHSDAVLRSLRRPGETGARARRRWRWGCRRCCPLLPSAAARCPACPRACAAPARTRLLQAPKGRPHPPTPTPCPAGYKIPAGGLFALVSAANYTGEIAEWCGYAAAAAAVGGRGGAAAAAFAFFTFCNLAPRGAQHHAWYRAKFANYPAGRAAVVPFIW